MVKAGQANERTVSSQEEEYAKLTFTEVQMELSQGNTVDSTAFQKMIDENFGSGNATGTIGGENYIITITRNGTNYKMGSSGKIETLDELPIDFEPGVLEKSGNIYTINSIEDLVAFSYNVNSGAELYEGKTVTLGRNLDFNGSKDSYVDEDAKYTNDGKGYIPDNSKTSTIKELLTNTGGNGFIPIGDDYSNGNNFKGNFNGNGKKISNLFTRGNTYGGFFGNVISDVNITNLKLESCNISSSSVAGGILGRSANSIMITNCYISGSINSANAPTGGIIGVDNSSNGLIINCSVNCTVESSNDAGGIVGSNTSNLKVINCSNIGTVTTSGYYAGGIVGNGNTSNIIISNCYNFNSITAQGLVGGIARGGTIENCYNVGKIETKGSVPVGGIVPTGGNINNCHNTGNIIGIIKDITGEITGTQSVNDSNDYLIKTDENNNSLNANPNGATGKTKSQMDEIMSVQNFVNLMNSYVEENNADSTKTPLKKWKVENGRPVFAE